MFKKTFAAASLVVGAAAGALLLSSPAQADGRREVPHVINVYNTNTNTNTNNNDNKNMATVNIPNPLAWLL
ncbi:hypothetical protein [Actinomadura miaoliensis]|uniref:Uncharacterized protein n=1 Tax=Actinomadura miaoliensis TaxID=430685 RepID=A0ABP7WNC0_9ACTN